MSIKQCEWLSHARPAPFPFPLFLFPEFYFPIFPISWDLQIPACVLSALFAFDISAPMSTFYYVHVFILCIMFYLTFSIYPFKFFMYQTRATFITVAHLLVLVTIVKNISYINLKFKIHYYYYYIIIIIISCASVTCSL